MNTDIGTVLNEPSKCVMSYAHFVDMGQGANTNLNSIVHFSVENLVTYAIYAFKMFKWNIYNTITIFN